MLACWAATGDLKSTKECAEQATALYTCMRTTVRLLPCFLPMFYVVLILCVVFQAIPSEAATAYHKLPSG